MKIYNVEKLSVVQERKRNGEMVPSTLNALGQQFVQEKIEHGKTKATVSSLGQQLVMTRLELAKLKGGN